MINRKFATISFAALLLVWVPTAVLAGPITFGLASDYDNTANTVTAGPTANNLQTTGLFQDVFWYSLNNGAPRVGSGDYINSGNSLVLAGNSAVEGTGPYTSLNFTGPSISGGQSYLSIYNDLTQPGFNTFDATNGLTVSADILFVKHATSAGVVALYGGGQDGLALLATNGDGNNPDSVKLSLVWQSAGSGQELASTTLLASAFQTAASANGTKIPGTTDYWYRVQMGVTVIGDTFVVSGNFYNHSDPNNPNSLLGGLIGTVSFAGSLLNTDQTARYLQNPGQVGIMVRGNESIALPDNVGVSVTNFDVLTTTTTSTSPVPEPGSIVLLGTGFLGLAMFLRRKR